MSRPSDWPLPETGVRYIVPGYLLKDLIRKDGLISGLYLRAAGYYPQAAGHQVERPAHTDNLMLYCIGGEGSMEVAGASHPVSKGDLMMLPRGVAHAYKASDHKPWTLYWVHFAGNDARGFWDYLDFSIDRPVRTIGLGARLTSSFQMLMQVGTSEVLSTAIIYGSNVVREIISLIKMMQLQNSASQNDFSMTAIQKLMYDNLHAELDLDILAAAANMTREAFCRRYKMATGVSPYRHYLHFKMERACHLLEVTDQRVAHIAESLGYDDPYYFSRIFKNIMGMSPSRYRATRFG
ncbi:MAG: AraC family transcriptional regulator [Castellaniella sp.]